MEDFSQQFQLDLQLLDNNVELTVTAVYIYMGHF